MPLTKEQYLAEYSNAVSAGVKSKRRPTWQHLPAGHMYWSQYEREGAPLPGDAARTFLSQTNWGKAPKKA